MRKKPSAKEIKVRKARRAEQYLAKKARDAAAEPTVFEQAVVEAGPAVESILDQLNAGDDPTVAVAEPDITMEDAIKAGDAIIAAETEEVALTLKDAAEAAPVVKNTAGFEWWVKVGEKLVHKGHGQRNVVVRAGRAAGLLPAAATRRFAACTGTFQQRIESLFEE